MMSICLSVYDTSDHVSADTHHWEELLYRLLACRNIFAHEAIFFFLVEVTTTLMAVIGIDLQLFFAGQMVIDRKAAGGRAGGVKQGHREQDGTGNAWRQVHAIK